VQSEHPGRNDVTSLLANDPDVSGTHLLAATHGPQLAVRKGFWNVDLVDTGIKP
jgi:hypothetical protein